MIVNAYAVLDAFLCLLRLAVGALAAGLAWRLWRQSRRGVELEVRRTWEDRSYLAALLALLALGLNLAAWPLFYALLQSYVPQWPGLMCIYGVLRIGAGSEGPSRFLPGLLTLLQATKPAVVFVSGAALVFYFLQRRAPSLELMRPVLLLVFLSGAATLVDATLEGAYLAIPKNEWFLSVGCCTTVVDQAKTSGRWLPSQLGGPQNERNLLGAYYGVNGLVVLLLLSYVCSRRPSPPAWLMVAVAGGTILAAPVSAAFLTEIAAPRMLGLPFHHCPYDLWPRAPEGIVGIGLFVLGCFGVGWAAIIQTFGAAVPREVRSGAVNRLLFVAAFGLLGSLLFFAMAVHVAA